MLLQRCKTNRKNSTRVTISRATHLMHLEESRYALYRESTNFLVAGDERRRPASIPETNLIAKGESSMPVSGETTNIPGYTHGTGEVAKSPISMEEWEQLKKSALF